MSDAKQRFSDRVENYFKYRPGYPEELIPLLQREAGLQPEQVVADIGSGTGFSAKLFLDNGNVVYGVEPNEPMRKAAEGFLREYPAFRSLHGSSEATGLPDKSVDVIVCAQAFHWFDKEATKREFSRIAKPEAQLILIWNDRKPNDPFQEGYSQIIDQFSIDYQQVTHRNITDEQIATFYAPGKFRKFVLHYEQQFDLQGLIGRVVSSSYMPNEQHPNYPQLLDALADIYHAFNKNGLITFAYETRVYLGPVASVQ